MLPTSPRTSSQRRLGSPRCCTHASPRETRLAPGWCLDRRPYFPLLSKVASGRRTVARSARAAVRWRGGVPPVPIGVMLPTSPRTSSQRRLGSPRCCTHPLLRETRLAPGWCLDRRPYFPHFVQGGRRQTHRSALGKVGGSAVRWRGGVPPVPIGVMLPTSPRTSSQRRLGSPRCCTHPQQRETRLAPRWCLDRRPYFPLLSKVAAATRTVARSAMSVAECASSN